MYPSVNRLAMALSDERAYRFDFSGLSKYFRDSFYWLSVKPQGICFHDILFKIHENTSAYVFYM